MQPWAILVHDCEELVVRVLGDADVDRRRGALSREDRGRFGQLEAANTVVLLALCQGDVQVPTKNACHHSEKPATRFAAASHFYRLALNLSLV